MSKAITLSKNQINNLIESCRSNDEKTFTKTLKEMEKTARGKYFIFKKEGVEIFLKCAEVFNKNTDNSIAQYNVLRLAKYTVDNENNLAKIYKEAWNLYKKTIFHTDGRIRIAGVRLLDRYFMGFSCLYGPRYLLQENPKKKINKKKIDEITDFTIEEYFYLQKLEEDYIKDHKKNLKSKDLPNKKGDIPWAADTKDKLLKAIRMGNEIFLRGTFFDEIMEERGYCKTKVANNKILSKIKLKYYKLKDETAFSDFQCTLCRKENIKIGGIIDAYSNNPKHFCEECAIKNYQEDEGFSSYKAAEARRRRMFDVSYLFNEMFTDLYLKEFSYTKIDDLNKADFNSIMKVCGELYNNLYDKEEKIRLEETESQEKIEREFRLILDTLDLKKLFNTEHNTC